jgi:hypothetical protein
MVVIDQHTTRLSLRNEQQQAVKITTFKPGIFTMLTTIKRKLAILVRKKQRTSHSYMLGGGLQEPRSRQMSLDHSFFSGERDHSPELQIAANRTYRAIGWRGEADQISTFDHDDEHDRSRSVASSGADSTGTAPSRILQHQPERDPKNQRATLSEAEIIGPIVVRCEGRHHQAFLLTADMYEWIQNIARVARELHELDLNITEFTEQANKLHAAKEMLEVRVGNTVPGALSSIKDGGETARRQLLMPAIRRRLWICERQLHELTERRHVMAAKLDASQQQILGALGKIGVVTR